MRRFATLYAIDADETLEWRSPLAMRSSQNIVTSAPSKPWVLPRSRSNPWMICSSRSRLGWFGRNEQGRRTFWWRPAYIAEILSTPSRAGEASRQKYNSQHWKRPASSMPRVRQGLCMNTFISTAIALRSNTSWPRSIGFPQSWCFSTSTTQREMNGSLPDEWRGCIKVGSRLPWTARISRKAWRVPRLHRCSAPGKCGLARRGRKAPTYEPDDSLQPKPNTRVI